MCGIVGYVGTQTGCGRRRRGPAAAGVPRVRLRRRRGRRRRRPGTCARRPASWPTSRTLLAERPAARQSTIGIGHTRWATHGAPTDRNAHPHVDDDGTRRGHPQRDHRELRRAARRARGAAVTSCARDTDTEVVAHLLERAYAETGDDLAEAMRAVCRRLEGAFTLVARRTRRTRRRRRRPPQLPAGRRARRRRELPRLRRRRVHRAHPRGDRARPGPGRRAAAATASRVTDFDGAPVDGERVPRRLGRRRRREGRLRLLHAQGDRRAAAGRRRHPARPHRRRRRAARWTRCGCPTRTCATIDKIFIIACGTAYHAGLHREVRDRALDPDARARSSSPREFRYRDPMLDRDTLVIAISQSGETMDTLMALRHAREQGARVLGDLQHQRLDDPARVRRRALHPRRPRGRGRVDQGVPDPDRRLLPGRALPRAGARHASSATRSRARRASSPTMPGARSTRCSTRSSRCARSRASSSDAKAVLFLGRHVGYPVALEGALKLKELAYMHAEGFAGRRAQARADRADRGGPAGRRRRAVAARAQRRCTTRSSVEHPGGPGPRRAHDRDRRGGRRAPSRRTPTTLIRVPAVPTLLQPLVATVPLQVLRVRAGDRRTGYDVDQPRNLAKSVTVE